METLKGQLALLTGATGGIGRAIARALAHKGLNLALVGRNKTALDGLRTELLGTGVDVVAVAADLTDRSQRRNLPIRVASRAGEIDILINNAGVTQVGAFAEIDPEEVRSVLELNTVAPMLVSRTVLPRMIERKAGHIVNISSLAGRVGLPWASVYAASKAALTEWTLALNTELRDTGVIATAIAPGLVSDAGMFADLAVKAPALLGTSTPEAVAEAVVSALEGNGGEVIVSSRPARGVMAARALAPGVVESTARRLGLLDYLRSLSGKRRE
jgi:short-subunit dehydrogenase